MSNRLGASLCKWLPAMPAGPESHENRNGNVVGVTVGITRLCVRHYFGSVRD